MKLFITDKEIEKLCEEKINDIKKQHFKIIEDLKNDYHRKIIERYNHVSPRTIAREDYIDKLEKENKLLVEENKLLKNKRVKVVLLKG